MYYCTSQLQSSQWLWSHLESCWHYALHLQLIQKGELYFSYKNYFRPIRRFLRTSAYIVMLHCYIVTATAHWDCNSLSRLISEECGETQLKQIFRCADKGRKEIVDMITFECFEIGKRGPCDDGDLFVLNKDSDVSFQELWFCQTISSFLVLGFTLHQ